MGGLDELGGLLTGLDERLRTPDASPAHQAASGPATESEDTQEETRGRSRGLAKDSDPFCKLGHKASNRPEASSGPAASSSEAQDSAGRAGIPSQSEAQDWAGQVEACRVAAENVRQQRQEDAAARAAASAAFCAPKDHDIVTFGKHKGRTFIAVLEEDVSYVKWVLETCDEQSSQGLVRFKDWLLAKASGQA